MKLSYIMCIPQQRNEKKKISQLWEKNSLFFPVGRHWSEDNVLDPAPVLHQQGRADVRLNTSESFNRVSNFVDDHENKCLLEFKLVSQDKCSKAHRALSTRPDLRKHVWHSGNYFSMWDSMAINLQRQIPTGFLVGAPAKILTEWIA